MHKIDKLLEILKRRQTVNGFESCMPLRSKCESPDTSNLSNRGDKLYYIIKLGHIF